MPNDHTPRSLGIHHQATTADGLAAELNKLVQEGQYAEARQLAESTLQESGNDPYIAFEFARFIAFENKEAGIQWYTRFLHDHCRTVDAHYCLARLQFIVGDFDAGLATVHDIATYAPRLTDLLNLYVIHSMYSPTLDPVQDLNRLRRMVRSQFGAPIKATGAVSKRPRYIIGLACSNLNLHAISKFAGPLLKGLDRKKFLVVVFSSTATVDEVTLQLQKLADLWYDVHKMEDPDLLELIRSERVDVLIDLDNHTRSNRLWVFAQRAAPVQMTFYGFNTSTGLEAMDYRLSDWTVDPAGFENHFTEKLLRTNCCHIAHEPATRGPAAAPWRANGYLTFGSFNEWKKIDHSQVKRWAQILREHPGSQLLVVGFDDALAKLNLERWLAFENIDPARVRIEGRVGILDLERLIQSVDLAIDSWPFGGAVTTALTLSLGVPVITALGSRSVSRVSASILNDLGLTHYICPTIDDLPAHVATTVSDLNRLDSDRRLAAERFAQTIGNPVRLGNEVGDLIVRSIERYRKAQPPEHDCIGGNKILET